MPTWVDLVKARVPKRAPTNQAQISTVERWRSTVAKYFPEDAVEDSLATMWLESGGSPTAHNPGTSRTPEDSYGLFQINRNAHGGTADQWKNGEANIRKAAELFKDQGWVPWTNAMNMLGTGQKRYSGVAVTPPRSGEEGLQGGNLPPRPNRSDYPPGPEGTYSYNEDYRAYQEQTINQLTIDRALAGSDLTAQFVDDLISEYGQQIEAGQLTLQQGTAEFSRRLSAITEANDFFTKTMNRALPSGATHYPNSFYRGDVPLTGSVELNPFQMAIDLVNQTPRLDTGVPGPGFNVRDIYENSPFASAMGEGATPPESPVEPLPSVPGIQNTGRLVGSIFGQGNKVANARNQAGSTGSELTNIIRDTPLAGVIRATGVDDAATGSAEWLLKQLESSGTKYSKSLIDALKKGFRPRFSR